MSLILTLFIKRSFTKLGKNIVFSVLVSVIETVSISAILPFIDIATKIPDPDKVLDDPETELSKIKNSDRAVELYFLTLSSVTNRVITICKYETDIDKKIEKMIKLFRTVTISLRYGFADLSSFVLHQVMGSREREVSEIARKALNKFISEEPKLGKEFTNRLSRVITYKLQVM